MLRLETLDIRRGVKIAGDNLAEKTLDIVSLKMRITWQCATNLSETVESITQLDDNKELREPTLVGAG